MDVGKRKEGKESGSSELEKSSGNQAKLLGHVDQVPRLVILV